MLRRGRSAAVRISSESDGLFDPPSMTVESSGITCKSPLLLGDLHMPGDGIWQI